MKWNEICLLKSHNIKLQNPVFGITNIEIHIWMRFFMVRNTNKCNFMKGILMESRFFMFKYKFLEAVVCEKDEYIVFKRRDGRKSFISFSFSSCCRCYFIFYVKHIMCPPNTQWGILITVFYLTFWIVFTHFPSI